MIPTAGFAQVELRTSAELRDWLLVHHAQADSVWLDRRGAPQDRRCAHDATHLAAQTVRRQRRMLLARFVAARVRMAGRISA